MFARSKAHDRLIGLERLIEAYEHGCGSRYEMAAFLDVTEEFLEEALERYRNRYGDGVRCGKHMIKFEPWLTVTEMIM